MLNPQMMTPSERLLVKILNRHGLDPVKIPESNITGEKRPDFEVEIGHYHTTWEVKEINENPKEQKIEKTISEGQTYSIDSERRVKDDINRAIKQFISHGSTSTPCIIALMDNRGFFTKDLVLPYKIMLTLAGRGHFSTNQNGHRYEIYRDKSRISDHDFVSAIALIYKETEEIIIFHNPNAKFPLTSPPFTAILKNNYRLEKNDRGHDWIQYPSG